MIYWIDGQFGSWKTALAVYIAKQHINNIFWWDIKNGWFWTIILSNIKMDNTILKNYFYFDDDKLLEVLRLVNFINDIERPLYEKKLSTGFIQYDRHKFTKFIILYDESWAVMNNRIKLDNQNIYNEYINQNRKNNLDLYLISAEGTENMKFLRSKVDWWYYVKPTFLIKLPILNDFWTIFREQRDVEGKVKTISYTAKDYKGDYILKEKPIIEKMWFFWKPSIRKLYNDLHKNITDKDKLVFDMWLLNQINEYNPKYKSSSELILNQNNDV